ncbi:hypothetical protein HNQ60_002773 [Povalibacter uvarum]|uniref:Uncharacterized protein n=1 Tax=Povalibacter uvarum TaxID=732238 RepID=A0A841HPA0_9GAMM|nr:hypothetical protein [Povalibacter uvarum]MBB6093892.1 hypothetical protein [Povalibacter uvarum]
MLKSRVERIAAMGTQYTAADIVGFLDRCLKDNLCWSFVDLGHPYVYTANSRLTLYADDSRWALVSDVSGYNPRAGRFSSTITWLGNALRDLKPAGDKDQYTYNVEFITLIEGGPMHEAVQHFQGSTQPFDITMRDQTFRVPADLSRWVPNIESRSWPKGAHAEDVGRYVAFEYADVCRATDAEKRMHLDPDVPMLMTLDQWHHRWWHYYPAGHDFIGEAPSSYETYPLLADVLVHRDPARYRPTLEPNNHWTNWPAAGSL